MPPPQAKCLPQIVWVRRFSHRIHRIHRNSCWGYSPTDFTDLHRLFGCVDSPTDFTEFTETLAGDILPQISRIYTDCLGAPPKISSFCVNLCNLWENILSKKFCEFSVFCGRTSPTSSSVQICEICGRHFAAAEARIPPLLSTHPNHLCKSVKSVGEYTHPNHLC